MLSAPGLAQETKPAATPKVLNAAHILIAYEGASRSKATRTKEEALALAKKVADFAKGGSIKRFEELAAKYSDGPSKSKGGSLGNFAPNRMVKAFSDAAIKLKIGEVSEPVESDFGFHVIVRRDPFLSASHILVAYKGAERSEAKRSKAEALKLVNEIVKETQAKDADFAVLAKEHSDCPSREKGGNLGVFEPEQMAAAFTRATHGLKIGQTSGVVETQFGYHVILRKALPAPPPKASAKHILVQWKGSSRAEPNITRTKEEALARLNECIGKLKAGGKFETLAAEYSDGPSGPRGGDLGEFGQGQMVKEFDAVLFKMKPGETSGVVETAFGYHIIYRYE
jgi:parvulin-like peptidyl-prolyl isomerase